MPQGNISLIRDAYEKFARRDIPRIFALVADDIEIHESDLVPWGGTYYRHQGARDFVANLLKYIDTQIEVDEFVAAGDEVVVIARTRGRATATGNPFNVRAIHHWTFEAGKAICIVYDIDTPQRLRALQE
jgi:ketosteroid isomerase-like protein